MKHLAIFSAALFLFNCEVVAADCPFSIVPEEELTGRLAGRIVQIGSDPVAVIFPTRMERDDDGAPNAYHVGFTSIGRDPGLDHICNGGSVLEFKDGELVDKYGARGTVGSLNGVDPDTKWSRSALCKLDYIALRDAGFPECGPSNLCMIWYGIASSSRRCGFPNAFDGPDDSRCGVPIRQKNERGIEKAFYLTKTSLRRAGALDSSALQSDFANSSALPFIVLPGGLLLPRNAKWKIGDAALVFWKSEMVAAVIGDIGPRGKFGEGSRALLNQLRGGASTTIEGDDSVVTILLPGTANDLLGEWPISQKKLDKIAKSAMRRIGGVKALKSCPSFSFSP